MAEFGKMQELPFWKGKAFEEVSREELEARSVKRAEEQDAKTERLSQIQEEKSDVFVPPSEAAASETQEKPAAKAVDMTGRGIDSLTRMEDRALVEREAHPSRAQSFPHCSTVSPFSAAKKRMSVRSWHGLRCTRRIRKNCCACSAHPGNTATKSRTPITAKWQTRNCNSWQNCVRGSPRKAARRHPKSGGMRTRNDTTKNREEIK